MLSLRYPEFRISRIILLFFRLFALFKLDIMIVCTVHHLLSLKKRTFSPESSNLMIYFDLPCTAFSQAFRVNSFHLRLDHVTRNAFAARNNEAYGPGKPRITILILCSSTCKPYVLVCLICTSKPGIIFRDSDSFHCFSKFCFHLFRLTLLNEQVFQKTLDILAFLVCHQVKF